VKVFIIGCLLFLSAEMVTAETCPVEIFAEVPGVLSIDWDNVGEAASVDGKNVLKLHLKSGVHEVKFISSDRKWVGNEILTVGSLKENKIDFSKSTMTHLTGWIGKIGTTGPGGGTIFYDKGDAEGGWQYLEAAPQDLPKMQWNNGEYVDTGAEGTAVGTGKDNTDKIIATQGEGRYAAEACRSYRGGGFSDWYLPSQDELDLMFKVLKANEVGDFKSDWYWSSSQRRHINAWYEFFGNGLEFYRDTFHYDIYVRAVRAF